MRLSAFWELAIRSLVFAVGATLMAWVCDIPPTGKSAAFMLFCAFWSGFVFDGWKRSAKNGFKSGLENESSAVASRKAATEVMTPAQVAEAAHKTTRKPTSEPES